MSIEDEESIFWETIEQETRIVYGRYDEWYMDDRPYYARRRVRPMETVYLPEEDIT